MNCTILLSDLFEDEQWEEGAVIDLRDLEGTNGYCDAEAAQAIVKALSDCPAEGIHWIDSGDYHYLSEIFLRKVKEPFALVLYDNHPDDQDCAFGDDLLSCGNWVAYARRHNRFLREMSEGLPVYVSIDLDALSCDWARTNWDQGTMTLPQLEAKIRDISRSHRIIGFDVCGGITASKGGSPEDFAINVRTRKELQNFLSRL